MVEGRGYVYEGVARVLGAMELSCMLTAVVGV